MAEKPACAVDYSVAKQRSIYGATSNTCPLKTPPGWTQRHFHSSSIASMNSLFHLSNLLLPDVIIFAPFFIVLHVLHVSLIRGGSGDLARSREAIPQSRRGSP